MSVRYVIGRGEEVLAATESWVRSVPEAGVPPWSEPVKSGESAGAMGAWSDHRRQVGDRLEEIELAARLVVAMMASVHRRATA